MCFAFLNILWCLLPRSQSNQCLCRDNEQDVAKYQMQFPKHVRSEVQYYGPLHASRQIFLPTIPHDSLKTYNWAQGSYMYADWMDIMINSWCEAILVQVYYTWVWVKNPLPNESRVIFSLLLIVQKCDLEKLN